MVEHKCIHILQQSLFQSYLNHIESALSWAVLARWVGGCEFVLVFAHRLTRLTLDT